MRLYALVEAGDPEAIDIYLHEHDAQHALEDCLRDELQEPTPILVGRIFLAESWLNGLAWASP